MIFSDREEAGNRLADALTQFRGQHPLVLAIPRGAVPMAEIVAKMLGGELDVVLVRKLRAPNNAEFAIGSVAESGWWQIEPYAAEAGASASYISEEIACQLANIRQRRGMLGKALAPIDPCGRTVIVVDDGLATGATMAAALHAVRAQHPARVVCAVPVAAREALRRIAALADEVVCLYCPEIFDSMGRFYRNFAQVDDSEVMDCLSRARQSVPSVQT